MSFIAAMNFGLKRVTMPFNKKRAFTIRSESSAQRFNLKIPTTNTIYATPRMARNTLYGTCEIWIPNKKNGGRKGSGMNSIKTIQNALETSKAAMTAIGKGTDGFFGDGGGSAAAGAGKPEASKPRACGNSPEFWKAATTRGRVKRTNHQIPTPSGMP